MKTIRWGWVVAWTIVIFFLVLSIVVSFSPKTAVSATPSKIIEVVTVQPVASSTIPEAKKPPVVPKVLLDIAYCESGGRQFYADGSLVIGKIDHADTGKFQINKRFHLKTAKKMGLDLDTEEGNTAYALFLYKTQGTRPWLASKKCWSNIQTWKNTRRTYY